MAVSGFLQLAFCRLVRAGGQAGLEACPAPHWHTWGSSPPNSHGQHIRAGLPCSHGSLASVSLGEPGAGPSDRWRRGSLRAHGTTHLEGHGTGLAPHGAQCPLTESSDVNPQDFQRWFPILPIPQEAPVFWECNKVIHFFCGGGLGSTSSILVLAWASLERAPLGRCPAVGQSWDVREESP